MIVGFDGSRAFSKNRTGTENYSYQLLKALAKIDKKNQYKVFLRPNSVIPPSTVILNEAQRSEGSVDLKNAESTDSSLVLRMTNFGWPSNFKFITLNFPFLWTQVGLSIKTFTDPMDVLFVPAHTLPLVRAPWVKTVLTVHDLGSEYLPQTHQIKQRLYLSLMQNYQLQTATKLIAVSNATKEDLVKKIGLSASKIEVVYEGYDDSRFKIHDSRFKNNVLKNYSLQPNAYFLFVGTVQPRKNLERLITAFKNITGVTNKSRDTHDILGTRGTSKLVIVGKKGWLSDEIYSLPKKLGIEDQVKFLDYVKDEDLPALYSGAIAFVYPSLFEGFGLPILEAQASGTPVITSNVSSMPEVAGKGVVLVDPYSVDEIADAIIKVASNKSLVTSHNREKIIKAGLENVKRFSWEKAARETLKVLESTMSS